MTATIHGQWQGDVALEDDNGLGLIPLRILLDMAYRATQRDQATASWGGRAYDREALNLAADTARTIGLVELGSCDSCRDEPATQPMGDGRTFGPLCSSGAGGSRYDDRED